VKAAPKQQLIHVLQLAQRKRRWQQLERNRIQVQSVANGANGFLQHLILTLGERRQFAQQEPLEVIALNGGVAHWNQRDINDRELGVARMWSVTERTNLSAPDRGGASAAYDCAFRDVGKNLTGPGHGPREYPPDRLVLAVTASLEQHGELIVAWSKCDYVNGVLLTFSPGLSAHEAY